jgi:hypothetical protein
MSVMRFKRFTKVGVLKGIGRELLGRFFGRFNGNPIYGLTRGMTPVT